MELNDSAKNGDVETAWDSSEVGENAEIEYVPLMRVENSSSTNMGGTSVLLMKRFTGLTQFTRHHTLHFNMYHAKIVNIVLSKYDDDVEEYVSISSWFGLD